MEQLVSRRMDFRGIWYLKILRKYWEKRSFTFKNNKNYEHFTWWRVCICDNISLNSSQNGKYSKKNFVQKIKHTFLFLITFSRKSCRLCDNLGKYCREGHATDDNMTHAYCVLDNSGYRHTLRICNPYFFPHSKIFYVNAPRCHVHKYSLCLVKIDKVPIKICIEFENKMQVLLSIYYWYKL